MVGRVGRVGFRNGGKKGGRRGRLRDCVVDDGSLLVAGFNDPVKPFGLTNGLGNAKSRVLGDLGGREGGGRTLGEVVACGSGVLRSSGNLCEGRAGGKIPETGWERGGRGEVGRSLKLVIAGIFGGGEEGRCLTPATS